MCGICGIIGGHGSRKTVDWMTQSLRHRGPDHTGIWEVPGVCLGHCRLSIIDLSEAGHQPMSFQDYTLVCNGEIYNFRELRKDLKGPFLSNSDTEVILHLYDRYGEACVDHLRGMFAFAIWDARRQRLFAARDRLGIKPLYYLKLSKGFAFASELKSLRRLERGRLDRSALLDFFTYGYIPAPKTVYQGVSKLPPAHTLVYRPSGDLRIRRYWSPQPTLQRADSEEAGEELASLLQDCVRSHTLADVPVGVFLSGGLDSTAIVAQLKRAKTFTVGFDIEEHSETGDARLVADHFRTDHQLTMVNNLDLDEALSAMPVLYDEPFGDTSAWVTHIVCRAARREVKVALTGDGGDEIFSGYRRYDKWNLLQTSRAARLAARLLPPFSPAGNSLYRRGADELARYAALAGPFTPAQCRALLAPEILDVHDDPLWFFRQFWRPDLDPIKRFQWLDLNTYLPEDLLVKVDRASMAVSLEARPPLLDHRLVEFCLSLHPGLLRSPGQGKILLRKTLSGRVPEKILKKPKKGFGMPIRRWVNQRPEILAEATKRLYRYGILRIARPPRLKGDQTWSVLVLDRWVSHTQP